MAFQLVAANSLYYKENILLWTTNVLTNTPKISNITNRDIFQLNFLRGDEKI